MPKRMLIDATHPEEIRVVVINGTRLEEFDFESSTKRQVKGNIYLAKVTRVEPSLQAAFVDYGGNRHGFLAFSEIHPDYYRIPVGDRPQSATEAADGYGYGDRAGDNGAGNGEDAGVPLAAALPEPVAVPQSETEDESLADESADEPMPAAAPDSPEDAIGRNGLWENIPAADRDADRSDEEAPAAARGGNTNDQEGGGSAAAESVAPPETVPVSADLPFVAEPAPMEPESAAGAVPAAPSAPEPDRRFPEEPAGADAPVATDRQHDVDARPADREPAAMALRPAGETVLAAEIPEAGVSDAAGGGEHRHDAPGPGEPDRKAFDQDETGRGSGADRGPAAMALRAAEETVIAAEIPEPAVIETAGGNAPWHDEPDREEPQADFPAVSGDGGAAEFPAPESGGNGERDGADAELVPEFVETLGGDEVEEVEEADAAERRRRHPMRHYKIQEVIKRRQIMLVQVAKEERGNKGAALTTYLSLAGRYCVLMPNTNRGGGVSRKITSLADRRRLKDILEELDIPEGMGVIVRTAGAERSKAEIKRDYEYLLRLWNEIRDLTLRSTAPALIYEEANLIKRSIRDLYTRDIDEVLVEGEEGYRTAKAFMRTLMPSHAKRVQPYRDPQIGLFHRFQVESQIDAIHSPVAQLRSGGYLVINQTEALVAIDVNSGRSTRERNIEETALRTNLEAAEEIARQLRLRDLAGLIVIDFIDMEEHRNQIAVERRLKEALKNDRARIQVGRISPFGLLEMSRQRLRPSLTETSTQPCPHCGGTGFIRSVESTALHVLRSIEEEGIRRRSAEICVYVPTTVALYILNQKRDSLHQIESRYTLRVMVARDDSLIPPAFRLERLRPYGAGEAPPLRPIQAPASMEYDEEDEEGEESEAELDAAGETGAAEAGGESEPDHAADDERGRRRRRRRRRRDEGREARHGASPADDETESIGANGAGSEEQDEAAPAEAAREGDGEGEAERRRRRRGRRGGRLRPRRDEHRDEPREAVAAETVEIVAVEEAPIEEAPGAEAPAAETVMVPLYPWATGYALETASLAPFAGEPAVGEPARPEPVAAAGRDTGERPEPEAPAGEAAEPEAMPIAEAEEGVPFVSRSERELEAADAAEHPAPPAGEPVPQPPGIGSGAAAEPGVSGGSEGESGAPAEPPVAAAPEHGDIPPAFAASAEHRNIEPVAADAAQAEPAAPEPAVSAEPAQPEPVPLEPAYAEPAPAPASRPAEDVLVITERPANPRRGWWRRGAT